VKGVFSKATIRNQKPRNWRKENEKLRTKTKCGKKEAAFTISGSYYSIAILALDPLLSSVPLVGNCGADSKKLKQQRLKKNGYDCKRNMEYKKVYNNRTTITTDQ